MKGKVLEKLVTSKKVEIEQWLEIEQTLTFSKLVPFRNEESSWYWKFQIVIAHMWKISGRLHKKQQGRKNDFWNE